MNSQDPHGIPVALVNLRSELRAADERLQAADRHRNDVLRRLTAFCPFKVDDVFTAKDVPGSEWTVKNIVTSQDGQGWIIGGEMVRRQGGKVRQRTYRTFDIREGDTTLTKVPQPARLA